MFVLIVALCLQAVINMFVGPPLCQFISFATMHAICKHRTVAVVMSNGFDCGIKPEQ